LPQNPLVTGGNSLTDHWLIGGGDTAGQHNTYGYDAIGWSVDSVILIREAMYNSQVGNPCTMTEYQAMSYECDASLNFQYWDNVLNIVLYTDHEDVSRDTVGLTIYH
jgi:hypothetical protein